MIGKRDSDWDSRVSPKRPLLSAAKPVGAKAAPARLLGLAAAGWATWILFRTSPTFLVLSFSSTRELSRRSQAVCLTSMTPTSVRVLIVTRVVPSVPAPVIKNGTEHQA